MSGESRAEADSSSDQQRLQKVLAAAGVGSRRSCEELIQSGRVEVDRLVVTQLGTKVDPRQQEIRLDGVVIRPRQKQYYLVHKPPGYVSTSRDPSGRPRVLDLVPPGDAGLFTVGRLDLSSEGLILLTNDGELAQRLAHPRYGIEKTYRVLVAGILSEDELSLVCQGVHLAEGFVRPDLIRVKSRARNQTLLEIVLSEGRNREIRRTLARLGHKVLRLKRTAIAGLRLGKLPAGGYRPLGAQEISLLQAAAGRRRRTTAAGKPRDHKSVGARHSQGTSSGKGNRRRSRKSRKR